MSVVFEFVLIFTVKPVCLQYTSLHGMSTASPLHAFLILQILEAHSFD